MSASSRMTALIDRGSPEPLYHQVFLLLLRQIRSGAYTDGEGFPTEHELVEALEVSRITIRRALQELASRGVIIRERGRRTRVANYRPGTRLKAALDGMINNNRRLGQETTVRVLEFEYVRPTFEIATLMGCSEGDVLQRTVRVRLLEGIPFSYSVTHVPEEIGRTYSREDLIQEPLLHLLERCGVRVARAHQMITADAASARIADALSTNVGSPLLQSARTVYDDHNRVVEHIEVSYRPEYFHYEIDLERSTMEP